MTDLPPELQSELVEFVRYAGKSNAEDCTFCRRARKLAAKLPPPVDPDIEEGKEMSRIVIEQTGCSQGCGDMTAHFLQVAIAKRGRELERSGK